MYSKKTNLMVVFDVTHQNIKKVTSGFTAIAVSPNKVSGLVVAIVRKSSL